MLMKNQETASKYNVRVFLALPYRLKVVKVVATKDRCSNLKIFSLVGVCLTRALI